MVKRKRGKNVRKQRRVAKANAEKQYKDAPHSFIFARPGVGTYVKRLAKDMRLIFEPYTATKLMVSRRNTLKDFISIAGPMNVTHLMYLTHSNKSGKSDTFTSNVDDSNVYLHLVRSPRGPSFTFKVKEYCFAKEIASLIMRSFSRTQFFQPPLLVMTGFSSSDEVMSRTLRLTVDMFQNMLPPLNVQRLKLRNVKRVLLLSREEDPLTKEELIHLRHFHIRTENKEISKPLRRLGMGGAQLRKKSLSGLNPGGLGNSTGVPNLAKYRNMEDYLTKAGFTSDSGMSDFEDEQEVEFGKEATKRSELMGVKHGLPHLTSKKATIKLVELGPRLTMTLIKVEEGLNEGNVLYHKYHHFTEQELIQKMEDKQKQKQEKQQLQQELERRKLANKHKKEQLKSQHKKACLKGMGIDPSKEDSDQEPPEKKPAP
ncbi:hypothetical protein Ciccas_001388 [Cichlidogyrus casuarinus]|uniref:Brix domain-containing protein n=1 Tax=Cichlidogyrus casuarinus TaxID=1844966 RepID=A0ABD2QKQ1_9PLAT